MKLKSLLIILIPLLILPCQGCFLIKERVGKTDDYNCKEPPPDVFTSVGIDINFAKSKFSKVVTGDIDVKVEPEVISLASKAVTDDRIRNYLQCLSRHRDGFTVEQIGYQTILAAFMQTNPSPELFLEWQKENPFPVFKNLEIEDPNHSTDRKISEDSNQSDTQEKTKESRELISSQELNLLNPKSRVIETQKGFYRIYSDTIRLSFAQYFKIFSKFGDRFLEQEEFGAKVRGKKVEWKGYVYFVGSIADRIRLIIIPDNLNMSSAPKASVYYDKTLEKKLFSLRRGDEVVISGVVSASGEHPILIGKTFEVII